MLTVGGCLPVRLVLAFRAEDRTKAHFPGIHGGRPVRSPSKAVEALKKGQAIVFENIMLTLDGGGVRAVDKQGKDLGGHQAFWFAWSQFYPETVLWPM